MAVVNYFRLDSRRPNASTKRYCKYADVINEYILVNVDLRMFKRDIHKVRHDFKSYAIKYRNEDLLKDLEKGLKRKNISVQRIKRICAAIYAKSKPMFDKLSHLDKLIFHNFYANAKGNKRLINYDTNVTSEEIKRINERREERSKWVKKNKVDKDVLHSKMTVALMPYIKEFSKPIMNAKYGGHKGDEELTKMVDIVFKDKFYLEYALECSEKFKEAYGGLEKACEHFGIDCSKL